MSLRRSSPEKWTGAVVAVIAVAAFSPGCARPREPFVCGTDAARFHESERALDEAGRACEGGDALRCRTAADAARELGDLVLSIRLGRRACEGPEKRDDGHDNFDGCGPLRRTFFKACEEETRREPATAALEAVGAPADLPTSQCLRWFCREGPTLVPGLHEALPFSYACNRDVAAPDTSVQARAQAACDAGVGAACSVAARLDGLERQSPEDGERILELAERGCDLGDAYGCTLGGAAAAFGAPGSGVVPQRWTRTGPLLTRACRLGETFACVLSAPGASSTIGDAVGSTAPSLALPQLRFRGNRAVRALDLDLGARAALSPREMTDTDRLILTVKEVYENRGFYRARVESVAASHEMNQAVRIVTIADEGPLFRVRAAKVREVDAKGGESKPLFALPLSMKPGDVLSRARVAQAVTAVMRGYEDRGYVEAMLTAYPVRLDEKEAMADIALNVLRGPPSIIERVDIIGSVDTPELRSFVTIHDDDVFRPDQIERTQRALLRYGEWKRTFNHVTAATTQGKKPGAFVVRLECEQRPPHESAQSQPH